jgi:hypothetical protein
MFANLNFEWSVESTCHCYTAKNSMNTPYSAEYTAKNVKDDT